jgi:hypothetical protein
MSETRATRTSSKRAVPPWSPQPPRQFPPLPSVRHPSVVQGSRGSYLSWRIGFPRLALGVTVLGRGVAGFVAQILNDETQSRIQVQLLEHLLTPHRILDESRSHQIR